MTSPSAIEAPTPEPVIRTRNLARWYGQVIALTDLTVDVPPGITGLLGPNGAGKSTLMRLLTGQIHPSAGALRILGRNPARDPGVFRDIGFCSEDDTLYDDMTPLDMVAFLARCSGCSRREARDRAASALERTGIAHAMERRAGAFSKGMRQRTRMAAALVHDPRLLLLDEPMTGLDPVGRRDIMTLIRSFAGEGRSVLFSSHILHEVEAVAGHVAIINRGMLLAEGTLGEIQRDLEDYAFTLEIRCDDPRRLARELAGRPHVVGLAFRGEDTLAVSTDSSLALATELPPLALALDVDVREVRCPGEGLESLFERLMAR